VIDTATNKATGYVNDVVNPFVRPLIIGWSDSTKAYIGDLGVGPGFVNVVVGNSVTGTVSTTGFPPFDQPLNIVEGPDGTMYITDFVNNNVYLVDPTTDAVTATFTGTFSAPLGIGITTDNKTAYIAKSGNDTVSIVDVATQTQTAVVDASSFPFFVPYQLQIIGQALPPPPPSTSRPLQPICVRGKQKTDRFAAQSEVYNTITWCPSPSLSTTKYNLYRNGSLIKSLNASDELIFKEHAVTETTVYSVTAVGSSGEESAAVTVSLPENN
jgi:YVTN family beta-propeller protein